MPGAVIVEGSSNGLPLACCLGLFLPAPLYEGYRCEKRLLLGCSSSGGLVAAGRDRPMQVWDVAMGGKALTYRDHAMTFAHRVNAIVRTVSPAR